SHTRSPALRAIYAVVQIGSQLARAACGTRRSARTPARCEMAGAVRMLPVASAPAPPAGFRNLRRSMIFPTPTLNQTSRHVSPSPKRSVSASVECLPAAGTPPPTKLAGFRHIPLAARHIYLLPPCRLSEKSLPKSRSTHRSKKPLFDHLV